MQFRRIPPKHKPFFLGLTHKRAIEHAVKEKKKQKMGEKKKKD